MHSIFINPFIQIISYKQCDPWYYVVILAKCTSNNAIWHKLSEADDGVMQGGNAIDDKFSHRQ
jgi:ACR3 family arsenite efflux pump ArsB